MSPGFTINAFLMYLAKIFKCSYILSDAIITASSVQIDSVHLLMVGLSLVAFLHSFGFLSND